NFIFSAVAAALIHWLIADFGVWYGGGINLATGKPYPPTFNGLMECYMMAIPYMKNMLLGNSIYGAILFVSFELAQRKYAALLKPVYDAYSVFIFACGYNDGPAIRPGCIFMRCYF